MSDLLALAERCEKAAGSDMELDGLIHRAVTPDLADMNVGVLGWLSGGAHENPVRPPPYTSSIEAALTLVPEGCRFEEIARDVQWDDGQPEREWMASVVRRDESGSYAADFPAPGDTLALAICAACLRARAATEKRSHE